MLRFSAVRVFFKVRTIILRFSVGNAFCMRKLLTLRKTISPSVPPGSLMDFRSAFSSGATLPGTPRVAIIEAATRYTRSFSESPFSF